MKINKVLNSKVGLAVALGVMGAGFVVYSANKAKQSVIDVGQSINPVNDGNIFNQGVLSVGRAITGKDNWTLGGWIYDITHDDT